MASKKGSGNSTPIQDEQKKPTEQNEKATEDLTGSGCGICWPVENIFCTVK